MVFMKAHAAAPARKPIVTSDRHRGSAAVTRRSLSLPKETYEKAERIATQRHVTVNRAIIDLLNDGISTYEERRASFLELADRFQKATDPAEVSHLRNELARITFGE
jgi:hypothetical protein